MAKNTSKGLGKSPEIERIVNKAVASGKWSIEGTCGKAHGRLRHDSGRLVVFASTLSDYRGPKNLARDIRHVEAGLPGWGQPNVIEKAVTLKRVPMYA